MSALDLSAYSSGALAFLAGCAFIAGLARGFAGFGAALIFVPLASTVTSPAIAAPLLLVVDVVMAASLIPPAFRIAQRRDVGTMLIGTIIGVPAGTFILARADPIAIRWMIACLVGAVLVLLMSGWRFKGTPTTALTIAVGAVAGLFSGIAQVGGPPIVVYWLSVEKRPAVVRANIVLYFAVSAAITAVSYAFAGVLAMRIAGLALIVAPVYGLGLFLGSRSFGWANPATYRRICYALIAGAGIVSLPVLDGIIR
jgi:uncharacterized membrane protein YfcA